MPANPFPFVGLTDAEVAAARVKQGRNTIEEKSGDKSVITFTKVTKDTKVDDAKMKPPKS